MDDLWEGVKRMLGMSPLRHRPPPSEQVENDDQTIQKRLADQREREDAMRRIQALDVRVDVLTRRMHTHEQKPHR